MDTKRVNKYSVTKKKIEFLCEAHLKKIIEKTFSKVENIIPLLKNIQNERTNDFLYLEKEDYFYHFGSGYVFSNPDNPAEEFFVSPNGSKDKKITKEVKKRIEEYWEESNPFKNNFEYSNGQTLNKIFGTLDIPKRCKGNIIYVNSKATGSETGKNWRTAYRSISSAINSAKDNDQIWIATGVYVEDITIDKKKIEIFGGFKGNEKKGWYKKNHKVKIKGSIKLTNVGYDTKISGIEFVDYTKTKSSEGNSTCKVVGSTIYIEKGTPILSDCIIRNCNVSSSCGCCCSSSSYGGGIYNKDSNPIIINCIISNCNVSSSSYAHSSSFSYGGGIYNKDSNPIIINTKINNCKVIAEIESGKQEQLEANGGGIYNVNSTPKLINTIFENNTPSNIYITSPSSKTVEMEYSELDKKILKNLQSDIISKKINDNLDENESIVYHLTKNGLTTVNCDKEDDYGIIINSLKYEGKKLFFDKEYLYQQFRKNKIKGKINGVDFNWGTIFKAITDGKIAIDNEAIIDDLLNVDFLRANIEKYEAKRLTDVNSGHWDLWDNNSKDSILIKMDNELIARNPVEDIREGSVVGIDFGTKSTVVAYQKESEYTTLMQIGSGDLKRKIREKDFENPTIIQFLDINNFMESYKERKGRPYTLWSDITTSHTAMANLINSKSDDFYSFFYGLKQWAGGDNKKLIFKDKKNKEILIPEFKELKEDSFNPIEIYAYYIGSYINTMRNGIYLEYILSFPLSYEKTVCEKIEKSFEKGIRKSLPIPILNNSKIMEKFSVRTGVSEPAAYAISALKGYKIEPTGNENIYYAIFDFGGGTTDFDFGIWRNYVEEDGLYDYTIEHFGSGYDRYLGGENLLEYLSFEIFKSNQDILRKEDISFTLPPECKETPATKFLINDSQIAKLNMRKLMEKIRPIWEKKGKIEKGSIKAKTNVINQPNKKESQIFGKGIIQLSLVDSKGQDKRIELSINETEVEKMIKDRIELGVKKFFSKMNVAFKDKQNISEIKIFLAGNSSKSKIVKDLFNEYIEKSQNLKIKYKLFEPLSGNIDEKTDEITPNGKTGVAFGILSGREGGGIKLINRNRKDDDQSVFQYYIGRKKKGAFQLKINRNNNYNCWYKFVIASEYFFEIYYTSNPLAEAETDTINIESTSILRKRIKNNEPDKSAYIYIKLVQPTIIEWIASEEEPKKDVSGNKIYLGK